MRNSAPLSGFRQIPLLTPTLYLIPSNRQSTPPGPIVSNGSATPSAVFNSKYQSTVAAPSIRITTRPSLSRITSVPATVFNGQRISITESPVFETTGSPPLSTTTLPPTTAFTRNPAICPGLLHKKPSTKGKVKKRHIHSTSPASTNRRRKCSLNTWISRNRSVPPFHNRFAR